MDMVDYKNKVVAFTDGSTDNYDVLISTIPLNFLLITSEEILLKFREIEKRLQHNVVYIYTFMLEKPTGIKAHWFYVPQKEIPFYRITFLETLSGTRPKGRGLIQVEVSSLEHLDGRELKKIQEDIISNLKRLEVITSSNQINAVYRELLNPAYVIFHKEYEQDINQVLDYLKSLDIHSIGRYGSWKYTNMKDSLQDGRDIARLLTERI